MTSAFFAQVANADFSTSLGEKAASSLEALEKANKYSFDTGGIAVLIGSGTGNGVSADQIGSSFVKEINRLGEKARYFYYSAEWKGMSVEYHIGHSALGPWSVDDAAKHVKDAVKRMAAARNVHKGAMKTDQP